MAQDKPEERKFQGKGILGPEDLEEEDVAALNKKEKGHVSGA